MYNIEQIRKNYQKFPDHEIEKIALKESKGLRKEVLEILNNEIISRGLDVNLISWAKTESNKFKGEEKEELINKITSLACPKCLKNNERLFGFEIDKRTSILIGTQETRNEKILCLNCGKKEKLYAIIHTFFFGWWSVRGFPLTPFTLLRQLINFLFINKISDRIINRIISENTGHFRRKGTGGEVLAELIEQRNTENILEEGAYNAND